ncbi:MAG TPA: phage holin family protein [Polyangiaceae bacterium]|nr:phage holin family protein [Polyangiaceae bacterium]
MQRLEPSLSHASDDASTTDLVKEALAEAKELIALEVLLAKDEVKREVVATKSAGIALGASAVVLILAIALLLVSVALAIFPGPFPALVMGLVLMASAMIAALAGFKLLPKNPLGQTRKRLATDLEAVKERAL